MKPKNIFCQVLLAFFYIFFLSGLAQPAEFSKILVILNDQAATSSSGTEQGLSVKIVNIEGQNVATTAETLLAKHLIEAKYEVVTSDEIAPSSWLKKEDILDAKEGIVPKTRKVAAFHDANIIFIGSVKTGISTEDVLGMKMNKAVTTISYKMVDTASGGKLDIGSNSYKSADRSPEEAKHTSIESMATDIANIIVSKISSEFSVKEQKILSQYKKKLREKEIPAKPIVAQKPPQKKEKVEKKEKPPQEVIPSVQKTAQKMEKSEPAIVQAVPQIIIINPPMGRGFKVVEKQSTLTIEGLAKDPSGIEFVKINSHPVNLDLKGYFSYKATLTSGENRFLVVAMNKAGNISTKDVFIGHPEDKTPPQITLINPQVNRGFQVVMKKPAEKTMIEGLVKDDNGVLYLRINGRDASLNEDGYFSEKIALNKADDKIVIEAVDRAGNRANKEFQIAREYEETRAIESSLRENAPLTPIVKPVLWGLSIGVSRYSSSAVDLQYADKDALSLAQFLKKQEGKLFSEVHFETLVNEGVTRKSIIEGISTHLGRAAPDDLVFIFLAGHGIKHRQSGSYYFVPYDADFKSILSKGLRMSDFEEAVTILRKNVNKVVIAMDTCHSGALQAGVRSGDSGENLAEVLKEASGLFILAASKGGEESLENCDFKLHEKDSGHGAFTYALLQGMSGEANYDGNDYISLNELFVYVAKQVPRLTDGRQHPYFRSEGTDMPFVFTKR